MPPTNKTPPLIEFKGTTLPIVTVSLRSLQLGELGEAASALFGDDPFFDGEAAVLDLSQAAAASSAKWQFLKELFRTHGLNVIGVRGGSDELRESARTAGLPTYAAVDRSLRAAPRADDELPAPAAPPPVPEAKPEPAPEEKPAPAASAGARSPTLFLTRPLRSGQQIYARGGDLVVLAAVNSGAEVIADGNIHIYAPLHGRALAGASGDTEARIFSTRFDAQLVSVAGLYRTFDSGVPSDLAGKAVQVRLAEKTGDSSGKLVVEPLRTE
ncbi:MAG: Septum site-determining protein MinC [Candidatus Accumulibacter regalis]|uniref:Probable septum site-determining protein MinC n=1 Tax=Accumulibacter regalis TaxID=522306 RepID=A0A011QGK3_ACCRE|nr:septum site-determining protein MinC [Accumulibacter sp.]EXI88437.1 MAG: Septum site-determining protein MinC [Candidatus Accumulibacter regalis]HRE71064.1 septum site-determining protein MinC [Accumulibacter sp.]